MRDKIPVTMIPDSVAGYLMREEKIDKVIVGADRITKNAVFSKIGTYTHSVLAKEHKIPFYVATPISTFDPTLMEREVSTNRDCIHNVTLVPADAAVHNPAFDATPMERYCSHH